MRYVRRHLETQGLAAAPNFAAVVLIGSRPAGQTVLLRHLFPRALVWLFATVLQASDTFLGAQRKVDAWKR